MKSELVDEVYNFLIENDSKYMNWNPEIMKQYLKFFSQCSALGIVRQKGEIIGVGLARILNHSNLKMQVQDSYHLSNMGDTLFVDQICVTNKKAIPVLWAMMVERLGVREFFAGRRKGKLKVWKFERYNNRILKLESVG